MSNQKIKRRKKTYERIQNMTGQRQSRQLAYSKRLQDHNQHVDGK